MTHSHTVYCHAIAPSGLYFKLHSSEPWSRLKFNTINNMTIQSYNESRYCRPVSVKKKLQVRVLNVLLLSKALSCHNKSTRIRLLTVQRNWFSAFFVPYWHTRKIKKLLFTRCHSLVEDDCSCRMASIHNPANENLHRYAASTTWKLKINNPSRSRVAALTNYLSHVAVWRTSKVLLLHVTELSLLSLAEE